ncbi:MAG: hypothetical protein ACYCZM_15125 [Acidimicrobiales bacterium]
MKWFALPHRVGLAGMLAGTALLGAGLGTAAIATLPAAGAATAQLPAAAVREQNVNAAGRIRVALPSTGVGVNGNVSVSNLPTNSAGRIRVSTAPAGEPNTAFFNGSVPNSGRPTTLVSLNGPGVLKGFVAGNSSGDNNEFFILTIDGHTILSDGQNGYAWLGDSSVWGGSTTPPPYCSSCLAVHFFPPGGLNFTHSLVLEAEPTQGHADATYARVLYTTPN